MSARLPGILRDPTKPAAVLPGPAEPAPRALDAFERTVRDTIALVRPGSTVLLSTPPTATAVPGVAPSCPQVVDAATTERYRARIDERLQRLARDERAAGRDVRYVAHRLPTGVFLDDCHLDGEGNRLLAEDFARALAGASRAP